MSTSGKDNEDDISIDNSFLILKRQRRILRI